MLFKAAHNDFSPVGGCIVLILCNPPSIVGSAMSASALMEVTMPSPKKATPAHGTEAEMSSKKKVAAPARSAGKSQGEKSPQMDKQRTKSKSKA
ncbi:hypothetical protein F6X40_11330 [Paraburkholderia sp. UCT31]|uniref:hypothetical protein n=1 Tax=Paraburkholderia sp. UCT31 TaxID=2615209 RepID=UPI001655343A|nr:hypothetical protein [Paraburkholderia sp. UCT31]MBC8737396.1 hypothetical protein [Paraburkholderia sp. UCT31]